MENAPKVIVSEQEKRNSLYAALLDMRKNSDISFYGSVLQCMNITYSEMLPTAGVYFDPKLKMFNLKINPEFFCHKIDNTDERVAILLHEIMHVTHKHVFFDVHTGIDRMRLNAAMDLVINQYIKNLPEMALKIANFRDKNKNVFPPNKATEVYYELFEDAEQKNQKTGKWEKIETIPRPDEHGWDDADGEGGTDADGTPIDAKDKLEATQGLLRRAMEKSSFSYDQLPDSIKDLIKDIKTKLDKLDTRAILLRALKQTMPSKDTRKTWKRPSRRLGIIAQGNTQAMLPKVDIYMDTSGSISHHECNEFLEVITSFFQNGVSKIRLYKFHTALYNSTNIKKGYKIIQDEIESGGTDLQVVVDQIAKNKSDISIVLTDGYYGNVTRNKIPQTVFVISKNGTTEHPLKHLGVTVKAS